MVDRTPNPMSLYNKEKCCMGNYFIFYHALDEEEALSATQMAAVFAYDF
jgi:hypothetical protein